MPSLTFGAPSNRNKLSIWILLGTDSFLLWAPASYHTRLQNFRVHLSCCFLLRLHTHTLVCPCLPGVNSELFALSLSLVGSLEPVSLSLSLLEPLSKSCAGVSGSFSRATERPIKWKGIPLHSDSGHLSDKSLSLWGHPQEQERTERVFLNRQRYRLLAAALRPSAKRMGHQQGPPGACFKGDVMALLVVSLTASGMN